MKLFLWTAALSIYPCEAFLPASPLTCTAKQSTSSSRLHGINEWRDQALESKYTLDSYRPFDTSPPSIPAIIPILPFPFSDILLQGQRTQLNLYEQRFHELFQDAVENHCGICGMGLLAGNGMITTLPLCEVESFTRFGAEDSWVDKGDGLGNGSIFVTIRAVGRAKIAEDDLLQEDPYMKARVVEVLDDDASVLGLKEKSDSKLSGESSPLDVASSVAGNIENLMVSLASMEHKFEEMEDKKKKETARSTADKKEGGDEVMNRRLVNAQLESLFMTDSSEGVDMKDKAQNDETTDDDDEDEDEDVDEWAENEPDENLDRVAQFHQAFESAKETDTFGYVLQPTDAIDDPSPTESKKTIRTPKELTAISWAAFCTGEKNDIKRDVVKIQALDITNVLQRLQLASAMLREEKKVWKAKLALAGMKDNGNNEEEA
eukprot:CAMPEP_0172311418 /NCGR_PEP_ID=MMETSP1058-20130122/14662_1 /TAXON_ID=83371 /ORGANISM="Detonula confervacea, Strain CCMP 353" /LENGTH=432 /DNA_ID=CAMNT_0013024585 /DNA_START=57 /DNA_END=1355 /DNA_ORIENTATION=+